MPRRDGSGPRGQRMMDGRGLRLCRREFAREYTRDSFRRSDKDALLEQKSLLEHRLDYIYKQLEE